MLHFKLEPKTTGVNLEKLIGELIPENSVLYKDSGTWYFYEDEKTFDKCLWPDYTQKVSKCFEKFIRRVVKKLALAEYMKQDEHMIINTDLAIAKSEC